MSTPKALAAQIVLNKIKDIIDTEEYRMISEMEGVQAFCSAPETCCLA